MDCLIRPLLKCVPKGTGKLKDDSFSSTVVSQRIVTSLPGAEVKEPVVLSSIDMAAAGLLVVAPELFYKDTFEDHLLVPAIKYVLTAYPLFSGRLRKRKVRLERKMRRHCL